MSHKLFKLTQKLYGVPHLVDDKTFKSVTQYLYSRNTQLMSFGDKETQEDNEPSFDTELSVGVLTMRGPLTYRTTGWEGYCGGYSYEMLLEEAAEMISEGIKTIVIDADSGGGEAYGCFESTNELRKMCDDNGVTLYGYIDGSACSAMYAIICACDEVVANPYAEVGSIGVLIALYNDSKYLEKEGYQRTFITDGTQKVPFDAEGQFKQEFLDDLQEKVTKLGDDFRTHVSAYTNIPTQTLKDTNAKVYTAQDALSIGLINKIQTRSEFISYVVSQHTGKAR